MSLEAMHTCQQKAATPILTSVLLQRKCTCGNHTVAGGECAECRKKRLQRKAMGHSERETVPPIVHQVLRSSGQPLDPATRAFMEPRFGHDFSHVRVHTDAKAAESARAVNALAYTVGRDLVFGAGQYAPGTVAGQRILGHELTHTVQQSKAGTGTIEMEPSDAFEREANVVSEKVVSGTLPPTPFKPFGLTVPVLSRWKITGDTATVDSSEDRLGMLASSLKSDAGNWKCIRPIRMQTAENNPPNDFDAGYERYLQGGDTFDVSNLKTTFKGSSLALSLFGQSENAHIVAKTLYPGAKPSKDPDEDIRAEVQEGKAPLADFIVIGHQAGGRMYGASGQFDPGKLSADDPTQTFSRAKDAKFPRRCWFTHFGNTRSVGCSSDSFGQAFASVYLRNGAGIDTTTRAVAPACTKEFMKPDGSCDSINAIEFRPASGEARTNDHGPFKLSDPTTFHNSTFWNRIAGKL